ncbi:MAG TPA: hypothetical protein VFO39_14560 [Candidatus Sulfotelmatobacter sp.]|nr:hypothetical protein [Candidatus Sulfotelmatobacter sp.]
MSSTTTNLARSLCSLALFMAAAAGWAQPPAPRIVAAKFAPGTTARYEFEGQVHISTEHAPNVKLKAPSDCSYQLKAVLKFDFATASAEGTISGKISFQGVEAQVSQCASASQEQVTSAIRQLEASGSGFQVFPASDVRLTTPSTSDEPEIVSILRKAAWDLLQPRLSDAALAPESSWISSRRFLYWPDTFVEGMEVAGAAMQYARNVEVGKKKYAELEYKQVFSPTDMPAYVEARTRATDFSGTTLVTGRGGVTLLWSSVDQRIVYLHRKRTIDNRLMLKYDEADQPTRIGQLLVEEESTVRWLPEKNADTWLAELHRYESSAYEVSAEGRAKAREQQVTERRELSDLLDRAPKGFERWKRSFCSGAYCFELSVAVPQGTQVADSTGMTALLLSGSNDQTVMVAVGPLLDKQSLGLTTEELLHQQTLRFVSNQLWFGRGTGDAINFSSGSLHDRPAGSSEFTSTSRDLTPIRGRLVMVIGPFGRLVPVACAHNAQRGDLDAVCHSVTDSVIIR